MIRRRALAALLRRIVRRDSGTAVTEFGLIAPVFLVFLFGIYDIAHMMYARAVFAGAVESAARTSALEGTDTAVADAKVLKIIKPIVPDVTISATRKSYYDFADIGRPEKFTDSTFGPYANGTCDHNESFVDENNNNTWDRDIGKTGNGGASDVVQYSVTATYTPLFKIPFMPNMWNKRTLNATAIKKNQPFALQNGYSTKTGTCA